MPKLLEKSRGNVFVNTTDPSINVNGFTVPIKLVLPFTNKFPPIYVSFWIPTPPFTTNVPVVVEVEGTLLLIYMLPALKLTSPVNVLVMVVPPDPELFPIKLPII